MDDQQDLDAELFAQLLVQALLRACSVEIKLLDTRDDISPALAIRIRVGFSLSGFLLEHVSVLFAKFIPNFVLLLVTVLDHLLVGRARDDVPWCSEVAEEELSSRIDRFMVLTVDDIEEFIAVVLVGGNDRLDIFLYLCVRDTTLKWTIFSLKPGANILCNFGEVDDLAAGLLLDEVGNERLSGKGLAKHYGPLSLIAQMLIEHTLIPGAHSLQAVLLLHEGVN